MSIIKDIQTIRTRANGTWLSVKVITDQPGLYGIGSASDHYRCKVLQTAIETIAPMLIGRDASRIEDIWQAVCDSVRRAVAEAGVDPSSVAGIGYDATCSLVALGEGGRPLSVSPSGDPQRNVIVWMDHRAMDETRRINRSGERVLDYVGGTISPEMETPKLLWLAENMPATLLRNWATSAGVTWV